LQSNNQFRQIDTALPDENTIWQTSCGLSCSEKQNKMLWDTFIKEYGMLSDSDKISLSSASGYGTITIYGSIGVNNYTNSYAITKKTPKTAALYIRMVNERWRNAAKRCFTAILGKSNLSGQISVSLYNGATLGIEDSSPIAEANAGKSRGKFCIRLLMKQLNDTINIEKPIAYVYFEDSNGNYYMYYQSVSVNVIKKLKSINEGSETVY
jgi:hypothetical protein